MGSRFEPSLVLPIYVRAFAHLDQSKDADALTTAWLETDCCLEGFSVILPARPRGTVAELAVYFAYPLRLRARPGDSQTIRICGVASLSCHGC